MTILEIRKILNQKDEHMLDAGRRKVGSVRNQLDAFYQTKTNAPARTIAFISNKGGVGKTHLAINMAVRLSQAGRRKSRR